jgi:hypothetical protein
MFKNITPISLEKHKDIKVKQIDNFNFARNVNMASIMVHEFSRAASIYPIVFVEDKANDVFKPVVLFGFDEGENLFVDSENKWKSSYIPAIIRRYPFALAKADDNGKFTVCIDEESEFVNKEEGQALFDGDKPADVMERVKRYLAELQQMDAFTEEFCKFMVSKNMFTPLNMKIKVENEIKNISGAYIINEERLNSLSDETYLELRTKKYIPVIYSHLSSLSQIERLMGFKDEKLTSTKELSEHFSE